MDQFDNPIPGLSISYDSGNQAGSVNPSGMLTGGTKSGVYGSSGTARVTQGTITRSAQATVTLVGTEVQGIVASDQVWTVKNSPYLIVDTIQIPSGVTLTIEPDVEVRSTRSASGAMFLVHGELYAHGTSTRPILFEGTEASDFFSGKGSNAQSLVDLEYVAIRNGRSLWPATGHQQYGTFRLRNSQITNISGFSYIWYPGQDVHVEYNSFVDSAGFSIGHKGPSAQAFTSDTIASATIEVSLFKIGPAMTEKPKFGTTHSIGLPESSWSCRRDMILQRWRPQKTTGVPTMRPQ